MLHSEDVGIENIIKSRINVVQAWMEFDLYRLHRRRNRETGEALASPPPPNENIVLLLYIDYY